jgi:hypothetical protein
MVLRHDDPWWDKNYPPNGWGCQCYVRCLTEGEVRRGGHTVVSGSDLPDAATDPRWQHAHGKGPALDLGPIPQSDLLQAAQEPVKTHMPELPQQSEPKAETPEPAPQVPAVQDGGPIPQSELLESLDKERAEAKAEEEAKAKEEVETKAAEQKMIDVVIRAQEVVLKKLDADKAAKMKLALEAMAKAFADPFGLEEMPLGTFATCYAKVKEGVEIPEPKDYTRIRFNKDFVKKCLAGKTINGVDTYGFYIDPKTLKEINIPSMARLEKLAVHELAHLIYWHHSEEHDKLVYDCMCELVPDYPNWHRVLDHRSGVYPWKSRPNQMGNLKWNLMRLLKKLKNPWQR